MPKCGDNSKCSDELKKLKCLLKSKFPCGNVTPISSVPYSITKSGRYCVTKDFSFTSPNPAIQILTNDVSIDLNGHTLTISGYDATTGDQANGIYASGYNNIQIENGGFTGVNPAIAININNGQNIWISKIIFDSVSGLVLSTCNNIGVSKCVFQNIVLNNIYSAVGLAAYSSDNGIVEKCKFINNNATGTNLETYPIDFSYANAASPVPCQNWIVRNINLVDSSFVPAFINGLIVENTTNTITDPNYDLAIAQIGYGLDQFNVNEVANNVIIRDSTYTAINSSAAQGLDGILIVAGSNVLVENVSVNLNAPSYPDAGYFSNAAIHVGYPLQFVPNAIVNGVKINNVVVSSTPNIGINIDAGASGVSIDNAVVSGSLSANIQIAGGINNGVKNSDISGGQNNGIAITGGATNNVILSNNVAGNIGAGIIFDNISANNLVKNNNVLGNGAGIVDLLNANTQVDNTSFNNGTATTMIKRADAKKPVVKVLRRRGNRKLPKQR